MKYFCVLFSILFISNHSQAQVWVDEGAIWHYDFWNIATEGFYEYTYTEDVLIDEQDCQKIEGRRYLYGMGGPDGDYVLLSESSMGEFYTYVSGDTIFYREGDEFRVLLNFSAEVGDAWLISTTNNWGFGCSDSSYVEVIEVGSITIGGTDYRTITLEPTSESAFGFRGVFCERFGNVSGGTDPYYDLFPHDYACEEIVETEIIEWDYAGFKCFQDNSFELYNPDGETCDWWRVNLTIDESPSQELSFYPNPANDEIIINNQNGVDYGLYALDGTLIEKGLIEHSHISISHLTNGTYVLGINGKKTKLVVLH